MKELLFICNDQFGYHTDSLKYCEYLNHDYQISYLCFDKGYERIYVEDIKVVYISWNKWKLLRSIFFVLGAVKEMLKCKGVSFIIYFKGFLILQLLIPWKKKVLDIRTLSVESDQNQRKREDRNLKITTKFFSRISIISEELRDKLNLPVEKVFILPLGADTISTKAKTYDTIRLLYVGNMSGRNILDTVKGVHCFVQNNPSLPISYDIIGDGYELDSIKEYISKNNLEAIIHLHGRIHHKDITPFFDKCNVGFCYIPITDYFNLQPPTKLFEYAASGLYNIATATIANKKYISSDNGVLISDTVVGVYEGLKHIQSILHDIQEVRIKNSVKQYSWNNIAHSYLSVYLERVLNA